MLVNCNYVFPSVVERIGQFSVKNTLQERNPLQTWHQKNDIVIYQYTFHATHISEILYLSSPFCRLDVLWPVLGGLLVPVPLEQDRLLQPSQGLDQRRQLLWSQLVQAQPGPKGDQNHTVGRRGKDLRQVLRQGSEKICEMGVKYSMVSVLS